MTEGVFPMRVVIRAKARVSGPSNDVLCLNYSNCRLPIGIQLSHCDFLQLNDFLFIAIDFLLSLDLIACE